MFFPRRNQGEDAVPGTLTRPVSVNYEALESLFHLPLKDAAREMGLCPTTFKKACRRFSMDVWPFRKGQSRTPIVRRKTQTDDLRHQDNMNHGGAASVLCASPVWHDGSTAWMNRNFSFSATASSSSTVRASSSSDLARHAAPAFQLQPLPPAFLRTPFAPLDASSLARSVFIGVPIPSMTFEGEGLLPTRACGAEQGFEATRPCGADQGVEAPLEAGSCSAAVMTYLEGPLAGDFDFMFVEEEPFPTKKGGGEEEDLGWNIEKALARS